MAGRVRTTAKYQNTIWISTGVFLKISTYTWAVLRSSQLAESRNTPIRTPSTVASTIPTAATRIVFTSPTRKARV
jgi:hypothetical protein